MPRSKRGGYEVPNDIDIVKGGKKCWEVADTLADAIVKNFASVVVDHIDEMADKYRANLTNFAGYEARFKKQLLAWYRSFARYAPNVIRIYAKYRR